VCQPISADKPRTILRRRSKSDSAVRRQAAQRCEQQLPIFLATEAAVLHKYVVCKIRAQIVDKLTRNPEQQRFPRSS
jgi:hypothetical protein